MLSYVVYDLDRISEIYEDLSEEDMDLAKDAVESGDGVRLFQDGSLEDDETGELILDSVDEDLIDEDDFESEAEARKTTISVVSEAKMKTMTASALLLMAWNWIVW